LKALFCKAFRLLKIGFLAPFTSFSPYFITTITSYITKKTQKPLYFLRFSALLFFPIKTDNPLIPSTFISLKIVGIVFFYPPAFSARQKVKSVPIIFLNPCKQKVLGGLTRQDFHTAPAQIPACGTTALGSSEILASVKGKLALPSLLFPAGWLARPYPTGTFTLQDI